MIFGISSTEKSLLPCQPFKAMFVQRSKCSPTPPSPIKSLLFAGCRPQGESLPSQLIALTLSYPVKNVSSAPRARGEAGVDIHATADAPLHLVCGVRETSTPLERPALVICSSRPVWPAECVGQWTKPRILPDTFRVVRQRPTALVTARPQSRACAPRGRRRARRARRRGAAGPRPCAPRRRPCAAAARGPWGGARRPTRRARGTGAP